MSNILEFIDLKYFSNKLYYIGNLNLLEKIKIGIVGSRHPNSYAKNIISQISNKLSSHGICVVSGGAIGIDTIAHKNAGAKNTIMVAGTGLDIRYPKINDKLIKDIEEQGLIISQFEQNMPSLPRNFAIRNKLIVSLSDVLIVGYADKNSGTSRSIQYALDMKKDIYVLPHRILESKGTNELLERGYAKAIYNIDDFVSKFSKIQSSNGEIDKFLQYCQANPIYDNAIQEYGSKVLEYELAGKIKIINGSIIISNSSNINN